MYPDLYLPYPASLIKAVVYDIRDKSNVKKTREIELEGTYLSSRKIGSVLYILANKHLPYYAIGDSADDLTPRYRDSASSEGLVNIGFEAIRYFSGFVEPNYLIIAGVDLSAGEPVQVDAYLGAGDNVYVCQSNMYVAMTHYGADAVSREPRVSTQVYRFALKQGRTEINGMGKVLGTVLNQFSMDEYDGYFRLAATVGGDIPKNNIYILDEDLKVSGEITDIAPGETIYSARFMGNRGYLVTFRTVDPLFVIDLDPRSPKVLGALKIPGYSSYLHPYERDHLIGFGKDTVEVVDKDSRGNVVNVRAVELGLKVALFDVSDASAPVEKFSVRIGGRGSDSELLYNHKALLFDPERQLLAFPVEVRKEGADLFTYGELLFNGAYVYRIDPSRGFQLLGQISHWTDEDYLKAGFWGYCERNIQRIMFIKDTLYTLSLGMVKANDLHDLAQVGRLVIP